MIGIHDDDGDRLPITYNGLTLNDPTDPKDDTFEINAVSTLAPSQAPQEARPADDGTEIYDARKSMIVLRMDGTVRAPSLAKLYDKKRLLAAAFDPAKSSREDTSARNGFRALDFSVPTEDTTEYPTGLVPSRYYARARTTPIPMDSTSTGTAAFFVLDLLVPDPRRYYQTSESISANGTATNEGDFRTWPSLTYIMSGAGSATHSISNNPAAAWADTLTLVLDLSGCALSDVIEIDMERRRIELNGVEDPSLYVSGSYFPLEVGANVITWANTTGINSKSLGWNRAWAA